MRGDFLSIILGSKVSIDDLVQVARYGAELEFSHEYETRIKKAQSLVEKWVKEDRVMYGITTGFGALCTNSISQEDARKLQQNILISHATSLGEPLKEEQVRGIIFMVLQNVGQGFTGARLETMELYKEFLNRGVTPYAPREGSVGYLSPEAHIALPLIGLGRAYYKGELLESKEALKRAGLEPIELSFKEGLVLVSATTSVTAIGALALYDMINSAKQADIIGAMCLEILKGTTRAYDERLMSVRPHIHQKNTADNLRRILEDSEMAKHFYHYRLQDALSLRSIPQAHGAAKKTLYDAKEAIEVEMNSCCDNPIIWPEDDDGEAISGCNADSGFVGVEMDSCAIAATYIAKMSERRNNRLVNGNLSEYPWFLIKTPGLNSGLMIPQYTQAGLLNDMKTLSHPATVDSISTCGDQEDYVAMGYNASKKAAEISDKLESILAIELLSIFQAHQFFNEDYSPSSATKACIDEISKTVPFIENDVYLYPHIVHLKEMIHNGKILEIVEEKIGKLS